MYSKNFTRPTFASLWRVLPKHILSNALAWIANWIDLNTCFGFEIYVFSWNKSKHSSEWYTARPFEREMYSNSFPQKRPIQICIHKYKYARRSDRSFCIVWYDSFMYKCEIKKWLEYIIPSFRTGSKDKKILPCGVWKYRKLVIRKQIFILGL